MAYVTDDKDPGNTRLQKTRIALQRLKDMGCNALRSTPSLKSR